MVGLGQEGNNGNTGVTANDCDFLVRGVGALELRDEAGGTNDVEGGDTEETLGIIDTLGLEDLFYPAIRTPRVRAGLERKKTYLSGNGDCRVHGISDNEDVGVRRMVRGGLGQVTDDGSVGVEQVCKQKCLATLRT